MLAFRSLQQESRGLFISLYSSRGSSVQVVLESQLFQRFDERHATTVQEEIQHLIGTNQLKRFDCQQPSQQNNSKQGLSSSSAVALISVDDYTMGVWDALQYHHDHPPKSPSTTTTDLSISTSTTKSRHPDHCFQRMVDEAIVSWFLSQVLPHWTTVTMAKDTLQRKYWKHDLIVSSPHSDPSSHWPTTTSSNTANTTTTTTTTTSTNTSMVILSLDDAIRRLLHLNVWLVHDIQDEVYKLWLPHWGKSILEWKEACQRIWNQLIRKRNQEWSERNVLHANRHGSVSTKFVLDDLKSRGQLECITRPFGTFLRIVPSSF